MYKYIIMKNFINIKISKMPEGDYLATSDHYSELVATGKTIADALAEAKKWIAHIIAKPSVA
jgi:predicted RNase H-like HicB family nuclease